MDPEQETAFRHALDPGGLKIIEGRAGAGKSYTMGAVREAYEASGFRGGRTVAHEYGCPGHEKGWFQRSQHGALGHLAPGEQPAL